MGTTSERKVESLSFKVQEKTRKLTRKIADILNPKIPLEEINEHSIAKVILTQIGNPVQERLRGDRWINSFSIVDVLVNAGYVGFWNNTNYFEKFPKPYKKTRKALWQLVKAGVLKTIALEESDVNGERIYYKVENKELLKDFTQRKVETEPV